MADMLNPYVVDLVGGLVLNKSMFEMQPGEALELTNFEPDIGGGYRRINGFVKFNTNEVTSGSTTGAILMSAIYKDKVIAARGTEVFKLGSTGAVSSIDTGRTSAGRYDFDVYNMSGTEKIIWADGANNASSYDNSSVTDISGTGAPANPKYVKIFKNHAFYAGMSATPQKIIFSAPYAEGEFSAAKGAGSISVTSDIVGLKVFREQLYIFCTNAIFRLVGNSISDFQMQPVTTNVGCVAPQSIQEVGGDIIFLSADGLRTVAGTEKIGDVELGVISRPVQRRFTELNYTDAANTITSVVIRAKTQYRIFFSNSSAETESKGIIAVWRGDRWEFSEVKGIKPNCADSGYISNVETTVHGGYDGYIYKQETGSTFTNAGDSTLTIKGRYKSAHWTMGDPGIRKRFHRAILNYRPEGSLDTNLGLEYDYGSDDVLNPNSISISGAQEGAAIYGSASYGTAEYGGAEFVLVRQPIVGSGFAVALQFTDSATETCNPYSLKGFSLEFAAAGRR
jgi:hypothetical protein